MEKLTSQFTSIAVESTPQSEAEGYVRTAYDDGLDAYNNGDDPYARDSQTMQLVTSKLGNAQATVLKTIWLCGWFDGKTQRYDIEADLEFYIDEFMGAA